MKHGSKNRWKILLAATLVVPVLIVAGCDGDNNSKINALQISSTGTVKGVGVGSTSAELRDAFGVPVEDKLYYPVEPANADPDVDHKWSEITGPYHYGPGGPPDRVQRTLIYDDISFYTVRGKVIGYLITGEGARTSEGLKIGDSLDKAKEIYPDARCEESWQGETTSVREAHCDVELTGASLNVTDDPIESFTVGANALR